MTKADRIRNLISVGEKTASKIAEIVGTNPSYVYIIRHDIKSGGGDTKRLRHDQKMYKLRHTKKRNAQRKENYDKGRGNISNSHMCWTERETRMVTGEFKGTDRELGLLIGRTVRAIQAQRTKIKKEKAS